MLQQALQSDQLPAYFKQYIAHAGGEGQLMLILSPFISQLHQKLSTKLQNLAQNMRIAPFDRESVVAIATATLWPDLLQMIIRPLILELNVARLTGGLWGETPEAKFQSFVQQLNEPGKALAFFQEYPLVEQLLLSFLTAWESTVVTFFSRLCRDWETLCTNFQVDCTAQLVGLHISGDKHKCGQSVMIATFRNHNALFKIVYKPRSLALDVHFQELLHWLNQCAESSSLEISTPKFSYIPFQTLPILDCGSYGWTQFVEHIPCSSINEIQRFYRRQGCYLALLYILGGTDFHAENIIANGEFPVLIDLETLLQPYWANERITQLRSEMPSSKAINQSVLKIGLLPYFHWGNDASIGIEMSGLGGQAGQQYPTKVLAVNASGTDTMHIAYKQVTTVRQPNRPTLGQADVNTLDYVDEIVEGFTAMYKLLLQQRNQLLTIDGFLQRFSNDPVRVILRPTQIYCLLLQESFHPDLLRNTTTREQLFAKLWNEVKHTPALAKVLPFEQNALWRGDIPMFTTVPHSCTVWTDSGEPLFNYFEKSGLQMAQERLAQMDQHDLNLQTWLIRGSLTTLKALGETVVNTNHSLAETQEVATKEQLIKAATTIGDTIETLAWHEQGNVNWLAVAQISGYSSCLVELGVDLYSGSAGIALFLAYLGAITNQARYTQLAQSALATIEQQIDRHRSSVKMIGGYEGWGGLIYVFTQVGSLWNQPLYLKQAERMVDYLPELIEKDRALDVIGGAAGCLLALRSLYHLTQAPKVLAAAIQCGETLLAHAQPMPKGIGWTTSLRTSQPPTGLSHGAAGIAWALAALYALTGTARYQNAARQAIAYERSLFSQTAQNWPDFRFYNPGNSPKESDPRVWTNAWCHGATGIGLARLQLLPILQDQQLHHEVEVAIQTTLAHGFGHSHCLCHGDMGNLELLLQTSTIFHDPQLYQKTYCLANTILYSRDHYGWLCGEPMNLETPGLMTGLAGIGYGLLRLAEPTYVPSVLTLESPRNKQGF